MIIENLQKIKLSIPQHVKLIAVSKTQPLAKLMEVYNSGHRIFGENKAQEISIKQAEMPSDVEWHFIGHLQTNKVKLIAPFVDTIHSIDSLKLLQIVNKEAEKCNRVIKCLLEIYIAKEETKFGLDTGEALEVAASYRREKMKNVVITGVMGMASFIDDQKLLMKEFDLLNESFNTLKQVQFNDDPNFKEKSIGMSNDYQVAIEAGSTMIRVGTAIFGGRMK